MESNNEHHGEGRPDPLLQNAVVATTLRYPDEVTDPERILRR